MEDDTGVIPVNDEGPYAIHVVYYLLTTFCFSRRSCTATLLCAFFLSPPEGPYAIHVVYYLLTTVCFTSIMHCHVIVCILPIRVFCHVIVCVFPVTASIASTRYCVFLYAVKQTLTQWLNLSMSGQDARVSRCTLPELEQCVHDPCNATNRDSARHLFRSKHALASKIGDIFRWCLRGMLSFLTPRARHFCLPFICDGSFSSFTMQGLHVHMTAAFGDRLYHSDNPQDPYMAKGNSCVHPQNTVSTANILPRTPADVAGCISVVFTASNFTE